MAQLDYYSFPVKVILVFCLCVSCVGLHTYVNPNQCLK